LAENIRFDAKPAFILMGEMLNGQITRNWLCLSGYWFLNPTPALPKERAKKKEFVY
jgi:hypothetical protein